MGQFLAIGLTTDIFVKTEEINKAKLSLDDLTKTMEKKFYFNSKIFSVENKEYDGYVHFKLKDDVLYEQLISFLNEIYPELYDDTKYYTHIIDELKNMDKEKWIDWAKTKPEEAFQFNEYGMPDYIREDFTNISINYDTIILSMEGKIMMEEYGRQFVFMKSMIVKALKDHDLAGAIRIFITG